MDWLHDKSWSVFIGVAAEDRIVNSDYLKVICHEITPFLTGDIADKSLTEVIKIVNDLTGLEEQVNVVTTNTITAVHLPLAYPNIITTPFVKKGERVFVVRYRDSDTYYWFATGLDRKLHTLEFLRLFCSNLKNPKGEMNDSNTYFIEMDTLVNQNIRLQTSKSNGESYAYTIILDAKRSKITLSDDDGRTIGLDSEKDACFMKNKSNSIVSINEKDASIKADQDISIIAGRNISLVSGENITVKSTETTIIDTSGVSEITLNAGSILEKSGSTTRTITAGSIIDSSNGTVTTMDSSGSVMTGASMVMTGGSAVNISAPGMSMKSSGGQGSIITGNLDIDGMVNITQSLNVTGEGSFSGRVNAPNID